LKSSDGFLIGKAKDHQDAIDINVLKKIITNGCRECVKEAKIELVFTRKLQQTYFTNEETFEKWCNLEGNKGKLENALKKSYPSLFSVYFNCYSL